jgi:hypothetical protein
MCSTPHKWFELTALDVIVNRNVPAGGEQPDYTTAPALGPEFTGN